MRVVLSPYWQLVAAAVSMATVSALVCEKGFVVLFGLFAVYCWLLWGLPTLGSRMAGPAEKRPRMSLKQMLTVVACFALIVSVLVNDWPFRVRFAISRPAIDRLADQVERGYVLDEPRQAGLFRIRGAERRRVAAARYTCLWIDPDPAGPAGFVRCLPQEAKALFNLWSTTRMSEGWQYIVED